ncbi:MAG: hypothetical protein JWQ11_1417 [Rhizobacter sp.]|nr:hypothetical protein [Rhizobacter sp.]
MGTPFWHWLTRFGESGIVVPMAAVLVLVLVLSARNLRPAVVWLVPLGLAIAVTTASKIAFIGFGVGIASIDFTGFSGHAMFSAAVYPVIAMCLLTRARVRWQLLGVAAAYGLSVLVCISRLEIGAHSVSEVVLGFIIGAAASATAIVWLDHLPRARFAGVFAVGLAIWLSLAPQGPVLVESHDIVTRLSLRLADRATPYTRADLLKQVPTS